MYSEVRDQEEWEKIEQFEMRHPKWRLSEQPWQQWTLVSEVVLEAGKQRIDKWNLMARLGNQTRELITQCAAWFRPDIIYVKRPVYQCRFEPQVDFFRALTPLLDPKTERDFMCELRNEEDVGMWKCVHILKACEWKAKLEEMEMGCDAPDDDDDHNSNENEFTDWIEDDGDGDDREDVVADMEEGWDDGELETEAGGLNEEEEDDEEEDEKYWEEKFRKEVSSAEAMENLARWSVETTTELYKRQLKAMETREKIKNKDEDETALRGVRAKVSPEEWKVAGIGRWRKRIRRSKIPPELFLRAAVRPFTYRNLVKEIVLTRHAILDGEIGRQE
ncbi:hypothetical protein GH714_025993 [Hevea brasiliensis]|uniref:Uncharacterized protein n=1 Tax=Hevea brasiliensis TaxID=3981 RepID=A0A6A6MKY2_HEVBR|nr:hypothetical protein GH714_025993 [Hevea brasiliensis]